MLRGKGQAERARFGSWAAEEAARWLGLSQIFDGVSSFGPIEIRTITAL
jgi:hypothetical protein